MKRHELLERAERIRSLLFGVTDALNALGSWPRFDEDYKVERYPELNAENFDRIEGLSEALRLEFEKQFNKTFGF